ncbi:MAG: hypothetical protein UX20_C0024G0001, partial [Candidatus Magasanikbacteria bacterium GW2011_GWC2_45_8]
LEPEIVDILVCVGARGCRLRKNSGYNLSRRIFAGKEYRTISDTSFDIYQ